jgi:hypothetical protein
MANWWDTHSLNAVYADNGPDVQNLGNLVQNLAPIIGSLPQNPEEIQGLAQYHELMAQYHAGMNALYQQIENGQNNSESSS